jgi:secondary thiamine-phosphate synthase enzyme
MTVATESIKLQTRADAEIIDITSETQDAVNRSGLKDGVVTLFVPGSTAALTTIEYEEGALADFRRLFDEIASPNRQYAHNARWGDGNGHSHVRAALVGPSLAVPFVDGRLTLGTWQQIVLVDFDNQPRVRTIIAQIMGE